MKVLGQIMLRDFIRDHPDLKTAAEAWLAEIQEAGWTNTLEFKARYPRAKMLNQNQVLFLLKESSYSLMALFSFGAGILIIEQLQINSAGDKRKQDD